MLTPNGEQGQACSSAPESKFYFTFGFDDVFPYQGGWVEIWAKDYGEARDKFKKRFGLNKNGFLPFAFQYDEKMFSATNMATSGNMGYFCWEVVT